MIRATTTVALLLSLCPLAWAQAPTPEEWIGRAPGTDFELADWPTIGGWFDRIGEALPTAQTLEVGTSTEGRPFRICIISSPENLARLPQIQAMSRSIADPRNLSEAAAEKLLDEAVPILFVSCNMHSTEIAAAEMSMTLAWNLATSEKEPWAAARREVVTIVIPTMNPDGLDRVVSWYRKIVGPMKLLLYLSLINCTPDMITTAIGSHFPYRKPESSLDSSTHSGSRPSTGMCTSKAPGASACSFRLSVIL